MYNRANIHTPWLPSYPTSRVLRTTKISWVRANGLAPGNPRIPAPRIKSATKTDL